MRSRLSSSRPFSSFIVRAFGGEHHLLCPLLTCPRHSAPITQRPASILRGTGEISRGKTRYLRCIDAGFTKCTPTADGGLRGHVPARPEYITPDIRFLFIAPQLWIGRSNRSHSSRRSSGHEQSSLLMETPLPPSRPRLAATPLPFSLPSALRSGVQRTASAAKPGHRTSTYEVTRHAWRTRRSHRRCGDLSRSVRVDCRVGRLWLRSMLFNFSTFEPLGKELYFG